MEYHSVWFFTKNFLHSTDLTHPIITSVPPPTPPWRDGSYWGSSSNGRIVRGTHHLTQSPSLQGTHRPGNASSRERIVQGTHRLKDAEKTYSDSSRNAPIDRVFNFVRSSHSKWPQIEQKYNRVLIISYELIFRKIPVLISTTISLRTFFTCNVYYTETTECFDDTQGPRQ